MLAFGAAVAMPAWLVPIVIAVPIVGQVVNTIGSIINDFILHRRLEALDRQRTDREIAQHQELLTAITKAPAATTFEERP